MATTAMDSAKYDTRMLRLDQDYGSEGGVNVVMTKGSQGPKIPYFGILFTSIFMWAGAMAYYDFP